MDYIGNPNNEPKVFENKKILFMLNIVFNKSDDTVAEIILTRRGGHTPKTIWKHSI